VLRFQTITLLVAVATLVLTSSVLADSQRLFPIQDTGVIQGVPKPRRRCRSARCPPAASAGQVILKDPAVESLSSFIGIDGTNTTLNSGRIQINLKPLASARSAPAT
jgi:multidrug efflux pump